MKWIHSPSNTLKSALIRYVQVLTRNIQVGFSTVDWVSVQSKFESAKFVRSNLSGALLFSDRASIQNYAAEEASKRSGVFLEMGVYNGRSINKFTKTLLKSDPAREVYGLDSFKGLEESWSATDHYREFNLDGVTPKGIDLRVKIINGRVEDVLQDFLDLKNPSFALIHFDMDLYGPTKFAIEKLIPYLSSGTLILFDELYGYPGWENGEFKALNELISRERYTFKAFGPLQALIEIK